MKTICYTRIFVVIVGAITILPFLSSCREECNGKPPVIGVINYCNFDMAVEVDIIGGQKYVDTLGYMESLYYEAHETKVSLKFWESAPLVTLSRTKSIEAKNCWQYDFEIIPNDSNILYDFDVNKERIWSP